MSVYEKKEEKEKRVTEKLSSQKAEMDRLAKRACECFGSDAGKYMLNYIMNFSGFEHPNPQGNEFAEGQRSVYLHLRKLIKSQSPQLLQETEFNNYN